MEANFARAIIDNAVSTSVFPVFGVGGQADGTRGAEGMKISVIPARETSSRPEAWNAKRSSSLADDETRV